MKFIILGIALLLLVAPVMAEDEAATDANVSEEENVSAGITPDSFVWGIDVALDRIALALTRNPQSRAERGLHIAQERLQEIREMALKGDIDAAEKAQVEHGRALGKVEDAVGDIEEENATEELEDEIGLEVKVQKHHDAVEDLEQKLKLKVSGQLTDEQWAKLMDLIDSLSNQSASVEIKIKAERVKVKVRIHDEGKDADEVEDEINKRMNVTELDTELAMREKDRALKKWDDYVEKAERMNVTVTYSSDFDVLVAEGDALVLAMDFDGAKWKYLEAKHFAQRIKLTLVQEEREDEDEGNETEKNESHGRSYGAGKSNRSESDMNDSEEDEDEDEAEVEANASVNVSVYASL